MNDIDDLTRDELMSRLKSISLAVFMTALPSEMCLEVSTMTADGTSYQWIGYDDWKIFKLKKCAKDKWDDILGKLENKCLRIEDIEGTDLGKLVHSLV